MDDVLAFFALALTRFRRLFYSAAFVGVFHKWPGGIGYCKRGTDDKNQYVVHPEALQIVTILFDGKGLVSELSKSGKLKQYSKELHEALMAAKNWFTVKGNTTNLKMIKLLNPVGNDNCRQQRSTPSTSRGASRDQGARSLGFSQGCSWNPQKIKSHLKQQAPWRTEG